MPPGILKRRLLRHTARRREADFDLVAGDQLAGVDALVGVEGVLMVNWDIVAGRRGRA